MRKGMKRSLCLLLALVMCCGVLPLTAAAAGTGSGFDRFVSVNSFQPGTFSDVSAANWYYENVEAVYNLGLMIGRDDGSFDAEGNVTVAEAATIAARLYATYTGDRTTFTQGDPWYQVYVDYLTGKNLADFSGMTMTAPATRAQFASIVGGSFPPDGLAPVNRVADNAIPDVKSTDPYAEPIYRMYRAGILTGNDAAGTFAPASSIKRSEVAAIVGRMAVPSLRKSIALGDQTGAPPQPGSGMPDQPAPETSPAPAAGTDTVYALYREIVEQRESSYGKGSFTADSGAGVSNSLMMNGVGTVRLLDMNSDGIDELIIGYVEEPFSYKTGAITARKEIWTYDGSKTVQLVSGSPGGIGDFSSMKIRLVQIDGEWLFAEESGSAADYTVNYKGIRGGAFQTVHSLARDSVSKIDGAAVTSAECESMLSTWNTGSIWLPYYFVSAEKAEAVISDTQAARAQLGLN